VRPVSIGRCCATPSPTYGISRPTQVSASVSLHSSQGYQASQDPSPVAFSEEMANMLAITTAALMKSTKVKM